MSLRGGQGGGSSGNICIGVSKALLGLVDLRTYAERDKTSLLPYDCDSTVGNACTQRQAAKPPCNSSENLFARCTQNAYMQRSSFAVWHPTAVNIIWQVHRLVKQMLVQTDASEARASICDCTEQLLTAVLSQACHQSTKQLEQLGPHKEMHSCMIATKPAAAIVNREVYISPCALGQ